MERSCVFKLIDRSQRSFANGASLTEVLSQVDHYQALVRRAYGPIRNPFHCLFTSRAGLTSLVLYEYLRGKGILLPDSNQVIQTIWPIKRSVRLTFFGGNDILDTRPELINY